MTTPQAPIQATKLGSRSTPISQSIWMWIVLATLLAAGVRICHLDRASFWIDELNTVATCSRYAQADHWPLYRCKTLGYVPTYIALEAQGISLDGLDATQTENWQEAGITEIPVRWAAVLLGIATIPLVGLASRRVIGSRASIFLMFFLAIAPWHLYWSQAGRFYSQQFLFYSLSLLWYYRATRESSKRHMVAAMICLVLAFLTQPPVFVIVIAFAIDWIVSLLGKRSVKLGPFGWVCAVLALALCLGSWWINYSEAPDHWIQFGTHLHQSPITLLLGVIYFVGPVTFILAMMGFRMTWKVDRGQSIYFGLASLGIAMAFALLSFHYYAALRYTFVALLGFLVLAALAADKFYAAIRPKFGLLIALTPVGLALTSMAIVDYGYFTGGAGFHPRWRDAFAYVAQHRKPGEPVYAYPQIGKYYLQDSDVHFVPNSRADLLAIEQPAWIVVRAKQPIKTTDRSWLMELADFRAYFDTQALQPFTSLHVYYYEPSEHNSEP